MNAVIITLLLSGAVLLVYIYMAWQARRTADANERMADVAQRTGDQTATQARTLARPRLVYVRAESGAEGIKFTLRNAGRPITKLRLDDSAATITPAEHFGSNDEGHIFLKGRRTLPVTLRIEYVDELGHDDAMSVQLHLSRLVVRDYDSDEEGDVGDGSSPLQLTPNRTPIPPAPEVDAGEGGAFEILMARWPDFEAKVKTFAEFFDYSLVYCLATPLQGNHGLDITKAEDAALNGRREATLAGLALLNHLTHDIVNDLRSRPSSVDAARSFVIRFRTLLAAPTMLLLEELYEALGARSPQPAEFAKRMERLRSFKHDYESFARVANQHIGSEFFRPYVP